MHAFTDGVVLHADKDNPIHIGPSDTKADHEACLCGHSRDRRAFSRREPRLQIDVEVLKGAQPRSCGMRLDLCNVWNPVNSVRTKGSYTLRQTSEEKHS